MKNGGLKKVRGEINAAAPRAVDAFAPRCDARLPTSSTVLRSKMPIRMIPSFTVFRSSPSCGYKFPCSFVARWLKEIAPLSKHNISYESYPLNDLVKICRSSLWISWLPTRRSRT